MRLNPPWVFNLIAVYVLMIFIYPWILSIPTFTFLRPLDMILGDWIVSFRNSGIWNATLSYVLYIIWLVFGCTGRVRSPIPWVVIFLLSLAVSVLFAGLFQKPPISLQPLPLAIVGSIYIFNNTILAYWLSTLLASPPEVQFYVPLSQKFQDLVGR